MTDYRTILRLHQQNISQRIIATTLSCSRNTGSPLSDIESIHFLEIVEPRHQKASTIFSSQFAPEGWHGKIGDGPLADSILDRIVHDSFTIVIDGEESMRKRKGINPKDY